MNNSALARLSKGTALVEEHSSDSGKKQDRIEAVPKERSLSGYSYQVNHSATSRKMNSNGLSCPPDFIDLNRSMAHFPLARDSRKVVSWESDGNSMTTMLPSERTIQLTVEKDIHRLFTAFDINLLYHLIASAKMYEGLNLSFPSYKKALEYIRCGYFQKNIGVLKNSLEFLASVRITYKVDSPGQITLPSPIKRLKLPKTKSPSDFLAIELDGDFFGYATKLPTCRIPLPLLKNSAPQNLMSLIRASEWLHETDEDGIKYKYRKDVPLNIIARKIGLQRDERNKQIQTACYAVESVYEDRKGRINLIPYEGILRVVVWKEAEFKREEKAKNRVVPGVDKKSPKEITKDKVYLSVPYAEKDQAKKLGAKWDKDRKKWYIPAGKDVSIFSRWGRKAPIKRTAKVLADRPENDMGCWKQIKYEDDNGRSGYFWLNSKTGEERNELPRNV